MSIKAIIFDMDDTLIEDADATERTFTRVCQYAQEHYSLDPARLQQAAHQAAQHLWNTAPTYPYCHFIGISATEGMWGHFAGSDLHLQALHQWAPTYQRSIWSLATGEQGIHQESIDDELATLFRDVRRTSYSLFPEVEATLCELRTKYTLAMLTNGASDLQREKTRTLNLVPSFQSIVVSGEVGVGKPDPEVFQAVLSDLQVQSDEAVMVGDNLARDILGAYRSGIKGIWINRRGKAADAEYTPMIHATITKLDELAGVL